MACKDFQPLVQDIQVCSKSYLTALEALTKSGNQLADAFAAVFHNTPFVDAATTLQSLSKDLTAKVGDASQFIERDVIAMVTNMIERGSKDMNDESLLILARAFVLLIETQAQFYHTASQLINPVAENLTQPQTLLIGRDCSRHVRDACGTWICASLSTRSLRHGERLSLEECQMLSNMREGSRENNLVVQMRKKLKNLIETYITELPNLTAVELTMKAGFHENFHCLSTLLKLTCSGQIMASLLDKLRNNLCVQYSAHLHLEHSHDQRRLDEVKRHLQLEAKHFTLKVDGVVCKKLNDNNLDFKEKVKAICEVLQMQTHSLGVSINTDLVALHLLVESCPEVALLHSQLAVLLVYGAPHVIRIAHCSPSKEHHLPTLLEISTSSDRIEAQVTSSWFLYCGNPQLGEKEVKVGTVEVIFKKEVLFQTVLEKRRPPVPTIHLKFVHDMQFKRSTNFTSTLTECENHLHLLDLDQSLQNLILAFERLDPPSHLSSAQSYSFRQQGIMGAGLSVSDNNSRNVLVHGGNGPEKTMSAPLKPQTLIGPTVTITSEFSPTEEQSRWTPSYMGGRTGGMLSSKQNLASDVEVQDIVDFLSGCPTRSLHAPTQDPGSKSPQDSITPTSGSSSSSSNQSAGWGHPHDINTVRYGNYNPLFQENEAMDIHLKSPLSPSHTWSGQQISYYHQNAAPYYAPVMHAYDPGNEAEFAHYIATNLLGKRAPPVMDASPTHFHGHWSPRPDMNRTWPGGEGGRIDSRKNSLNNTWSTAHDSASSSDESSNNGENAYSMGLGLSGQNLLASVSRRRHSSDDACDTNRPHEHVNEVNRNLLDVVQMDAKSTKTWPPKVVWQQQRASSPMPQSVAVGSQRNSQPQVVKDTLNVHPPLTPQWSDPISVRQSHQPGWGLITGSTPVSPAASMTMLQPNQPPSAVSPSGLSTQQRRHPKLDRRNAYSHF